MFPYMLHTVVTVLLCAASFFGGVKLTERHYAEREAALDNALDKQRVLMRSGANHVPVAGPYVPKHCFTPGDSFDKRLGENGQATFLFPGGTPAKMK